MPSPYRCVSKGSSSMKSGHETDQKECSQKPQFEMEKLLKGSDVLVDSGSSKGRCCDDEEREEGEIIEDDLSILESHVDDILEDGEIRNDEVIGTVNNSDVILDKIDVGVSTNLEYGGNLDIIKFSPNDKESIIKHNWLSTSAPEGQLAGSEEYLSNIENSYDDQYTWKDKRLVNVKKTCSERSEQLLLQQRDHLVAFKFEMKNQKLELVKKHHKDLRQVVATNTSALQRKQQMDIIKQEFLSLRGDFDKHAQLQLRKFLVLQIETRNRERKLQECWIQKAKAGTLEEPIDTVPLSNPSFKLDQFNYPVSGANASPFRCSEKVATSTDLPKEGSIKDSEALVVSETRSSKYTATNSVRLPEKTFDGKGTCLFNRSEKASSPSQSSCANFDINENYASYSGLSKSLHPEELGNTHLMAECSSSIERFSVHRHPELLNTNSNNVPEAEQTYGCNNSTPVCLEGSYNSMEYSPSKYVLDGHNSNAGIPRHKNSPSDRLVIADNCLAAELENSLTSPAGSFQFAESSENPPVPAEAHQGQQNETVDSVMLSPVNKSSTRNQILGLAGVHKNATKEPLSSRREQILLAREEEISRVKRKYNQLLREVDAELSESWKKLKLLCGKAYKKERLSDGMDSVFDGATEATKRYFGDANTNVHEASSSQSQSPARAEVARSAQSQPVSPGCDRGRPAPVLQNDLQSVPCTPSPHLSATAHSNAIGTSARETMPLRIKISQHKVKLP